MLVLTRRVGETLKIGDDISLTILERKGNQVRLGVDAPRDVVILREEIYNNSKIKEGSSVEEKSYRSSL